MKEDGSEYCTWMRVLKHEWARGKEKCEDWKRS
jgi:hypothetical protein